jgi:hypothetical protein
MKYLGIIILMFLFYTGTGSLASNVPEDQARQVALNFFFEKAQPVKHFSYSDLKIAEVIPVSLDDQMVYYVFNFAGGGFIAVSSTDAVMPVLCYSFEGRYETGDQPENFAAWMKQYQGQILSAIENNISPRDGVPEAWDYYLNTPSYALKPFSGREILPLLTSNWDQGKFYNELCPADPAGPSGHCYTGCVATALGQLMNYFRWPDSGTGSYTYYCPPYDTLSVNFSEQTYNWDLMEPSLEHSNLELAKLLYNVGVSVDMVYGPNGSGMYNHKGAYTLRTYFKYSPETQYVFRDSTTMDWDSLIIAHLDQRIPMYYAGWDVPNISGHAFICDGYQDTNYYHFNWGWSSSYNGYFYTDNLNPGGSNFNLAQELIVHAFPDTSLYTYPGGCQGDVTFTNLFGTIGDGSGPVYPYENGSNCGWLIAPDDSVNNITLNLLNFDLADGDTLRVYDGESTTAPLLAAFSGIEIPDPVTSSGDVMYVSFTSDESIVQEGFLASFESEIPVYCSGSTVLNAQTDTLSDGSGSYEYHNSSACTWIINPPGASTLTLYFTEFATEADLVLLKIYDLQTQQVLAQLSGTYPNGVPDPVTSPSGKMFIAFSTNYTTTDAGWTAYYETDLVKVPEFQADNEFFVYPNPAADAVYIRFNDWNITNGNIVVKDLSGKVLINMALSPAASNPVKLDLITLADGMYLISLEENNKIKVCRKIIKN